MAVIAAAYVVSDGIRPDSFARWSAVCFAFAAWLFAVAS